MNYQEIISQEVKAFLMSEDITVSTVEKTQDDSLTEEQLKFAILIGNGKKGGLHVSATINKFFLKDQLDAFFHVIQRQMMLYAIECIKAGHRADMPIPYVPEITQTVMFDNITDAIKHANSIATLVTQFDIFKNSYFNKQTKIKK